MIFQEIKSIIDSGNVDVFRAFEQPIIEEFEGFLCLNDYIPLPIIVNNSYDRTQTIEVKDIDNDTIGYICFSNNGALIEADNMSEPLFAAYLRDINVDDFYAKIDYKITKDYLVVKKTKISDYIHIYSQSSGIWGSYIREDSFSIPLPRIKSISEIKAIPNIELPTDWHKENMVRAVQQPFAFERFLKNYHLLELLFDWQAMKEISDFYAVRNFSEAAEVLRNYEKDDIKRIKYVISTRYKNIDAIVEAINKVTTFSAIAKEIFYKYGKESNPLKDESIFDATLTKADLFKINSFTNDKGKLTLQPPDYNTFILNLVSYWIYRIRSSIAHSKIGEYQLSYRDEAFMIEFAEPLLQEIVIQCFTSPQQEAAVPIHSATVIPQQDRVEKKS